MARSKGKIVQARNIDPDIYELYKKNLESQNKMIVWELGELLNKAMELENDRFEMIPENKGGVNAKG